MIRARIRRLAAAVSVVVVATVMSAGIVTAAPPNWVMTVTPLPASVTPGTGAGFSVTITNNGPGNISALYLVDDSLATPVYLTSSRPGTCSELAPLTAPLRCAFGALNDDESVTVVVAYETPTAGSSFPITFQANTTGATFSDSKGRSHGDLLTKSVATGLSNNKNYAGYFSAVDGTGISNNANLTGNNKQSTALANIPAGVPATVEDGPNTTGSCVTDLDAGIDCSLLEGEWAVVNVAGGASFDEAFLVIMKFKNTTAPSAIFHSFGSPPQQELIETCSETGGAVPCFTWDDAADTATIFTFHNGSYIRGR